MKRQLHLMPIKFSRRVGAEMLRTFANLEPSEEQVDAFTERWSYGAWPWIGGIEVFRETQRLVREIWRGKQEGSEGQIVRMGLASARGENFPQLPIDVAWDEGGLVLRTRDLNDMVWLTLLQNGRRLAVCQNPECKAPFFIRYKRDQKYCSVACGMPARLESNRLWWARHGREWREQREHEKSKSQRRK